MTEMIEQSKRKHENQSGLSCFSKAWKDISFVYSPTGLNDGFIEIKR